MIVSMSNVSWIRDSYVLDEINWEVKSGENWAVIGLNGSGKTTLLKLITGYIRPSKGELSVLNNKSGSYDVRELRKSIGWVSTSLQEQFPPRDTSIEIAVSGKFATIGLYDIPEEEDLKRAADILINLGCEHLLDRPYSTLSQGEKQKVLIARALINSPKLLILDEPCTGLDFLAREQLLEAIENLAASEDAPNLFYVTHHTEEILPCFKNTLLMRKGKVHSSGKTRNIVTSENLSDFFGTPVNIAWQDNRPYMKMQK